MGTESQLISVRQAAIEASRRRRLRETCPRTGVACDDCGRELRRCLPPESFRAEVVFVRADCPGCARRFWIPDC